MNNTSIDKTKLKELIARFIVFVWQMDKIESGNISFWDSSGFLGREEDYKSAIAEETRKELNYIKWNKSWIGTGRIAECASKAITKAGNLVNKNQQVDFKNRLNPEHPKFHKDAEQALYDIYRNPKCPDYVAFEKAVEVFGKKYDTISFLFFVKDDTRFLPISPGNFDKSFELLDINYTTSYHCSWDNYRGFISIITEILSVMEEMIPMQGKPRLIDAHSFVWVIHEDKFKNWHTTPHQEDRIKQLINYDTTKRFDAEEREEIDADKSSYTITLTPPVSPTPLVPPKPKIVQIDYEKLNKAKKLVGDLGEAIVLQYEYDRLVQSDRLDLAQRIEHTSKVQGDFLGYDVKSFMDDGSELLIEVKSTKRNHQSAFYLSRNECNVGNGCFERGVKYRIYRLYYIDSEAGTANLVIYEPPFDSEHFIMEPESWRIEGLI